VAEGGGKQVTLDLGKLVPAGILAMTLLIGLGVWQSVQAMQTRVAELELQVDQLEAFSEQMDQLEQQLSTVRADVNDVSRARDEILEAMCRILERPAAQCGVPPASSSP